MPPPLHAVPVSASGEPVAIRNDPRDRPAADQPAHDGVARLQAPGAERQLVSPTGREDVPVVDESPRFFQGVVEGVPRAGLQIVQFLAERVAPRKGKALGEPAIERGLQPLVVGLADVEPRRADGAVLGEGAEHLADGPHEVGKRQTDARENGLCRGDVGGVGRRRQQRSERQVFQRRGVERSARTVARPGQELAQAGGVGHAQRQVRRQRSLNPQVPVLVIRRLAAELRVAVDGVLDPRGIRGDETGPVTGIDERRRLGDGWNTVIPVICRSVVAGAGGVVRGVEAKLAESLA